MACEMAQWTLWGLRTAAIFASLAWIVWSGIKPKPRDSKAWYDRVIRAVGGVIIMLALLYGLYLNR